MSLELPTVDCTQLDPSSIRKHIRTDGDVQLFKTTTGYKYYMTFLSRLCEAVQGQPLPVAEDTRATSSTTPDPIERTLNMLDEMNSWIDDIPPLDTPQRFGNLAFRTWGQRLAQVCLPRHSSSFPPVRFQDILATHSITRTLLRCINTLLHTFPSTLPPLELW
jgi:hypothetical protein